MAIKIEIDDSQIIMSTENTDGSKQMKLIDPEDFASAMAGQCRIETGLLPSNTRYYATNGQLTSIMLEIKPHTRRLRVGRQDYDAPLPACIMMITTQSEGAKRRRVTKSYMFSHKDIMLSNDTDLYRFPYGNVFRDGSICWGNIALPTVVHTYQMSVFPDLFLNTVFNGHLDSGIINEFKVPNTNIILTRGVELARYFNENKITVFPNDLLVRTGSKLNDLIRGGN